MRHITKNPMKQIAILMGYNTAYERQIISGILHYAHLAGDWSLYFVEPVDVQYKFKEWDGDGAIAHLDSTKLEDLENLPIPVVGIGRRSDDFLEAPNFFHVASNNKKVAQLAVDHFMGLGVPHFACFGIPDDLNFWADTRKHYFQKYVENAGYPCFSYEEGFYTTQNWKAVRDRQIQWLESLPKPIGIFSVMDMRARELVELCRLSGIAVPEQVCILGVDNDEAICNFSSPTISSISQGTKEMGLQAATFLDQMINREPRASPHYLVDPIGVIKRESTDFLNLEDKVMESALRFIQRNACRGIQVVDVIDHCGVSRSTLERRFKQTLKLTIRTKIEQIQLEQVQDLLTHTPLTLQNIADRAGFNTLQYMMYVFRKKFDMTPTMYRNLTQ